MSISRVEFVIRGALVVRGADEYEKGRVPNAMNVPAFVITAEGPMPMSTTFLKLVTHPSSSPSPLP